MSDVERLREVWEAWRQPDFGVADAERFYKVMLEAFPAICDVLEAAEEAHAHADDVVPDAFTCECYEASEIRKRFSESLACLHDQLEAQS